VPPVLFGRGIGLSSVRSPSMTSRLMHSEVFTLRTFAGMATNGGLRPRCRCRQKTCRRTRCKVLSFPGFPVAGRSSLAVINARDRVNTQMVTGGSDEGLRGVYPAPVWDATRKSQTKRKSSLNSKSGNLTVWPRTQARPGRRRYEEAQLVANDLHGIGVLRGHSGCLAGANLNRAVQLLSRRISLR
jgi:hypothetical protein